MPDANQQEVTHRRLREEQRRTASLQILGKRHVLGTNRDIRRIAWRYLKLNAYRQPCLIPHTGVILELVREALKQASDLFKYFLMCFTGPRID